MINGVLTERSVADVVPILETNQEGLRKTLEELVKQYKSRQEEMEGWKVCDSVFLSFLLFDLGCEGVVGLG
jgi:prefoldin subunit 2